MRNSDEVRRQGVAGAKTALAEHENAAELLGLFSEWYRAVSDEHNEKDVAVHPQTAVLAYNLRLREMPELAEAVGRVGQHEGKIEPGRWLFARLLGLAAAEEFAAGLVAGERRRYRMLGLQWYGAWKALFERLVELAIHSERFQAALWRELERQIADARDDPGRHALHSVRDAIREAARIYAKSPDLGQSWQMHLEGMATVETPHLFAIAQSVDPQRMLSLLGELPHPALLSECFDRTNPQDLPTLISLAPAGFDDAGKVLGEVMVVLALLKAIAEECRHLAWTTGSSDELLVAADAAGLEPTASELAAYVGRLIDALRARPDCTPLAWCWLERLVFEGERFGVWGFPPASAGGVVLDPLMTLISEVSSLLTAREDAVSWIQGAGPLWRIDRLCAVLAVAANERDTGTDTSEAVLKLLEKVVPQYAGAAEAIAKRRDVISRIGAWHVLHASEPARFALKLWDGVRRLRERAWRRSAKEDGNECGEIVVLWAMSAMEIAEPDRKLELWMSLKEILADAMQTDLAAASPGVWPAALQRLCRSFGAIRPADAQAAEDLLGDLLRPHLRADRGFLDMVFTLEGCGVSASAVSAAVSRWRVTPSELASRFLSHQSLHISRGYYDRFWLRRVVELAGTSLEEIGVGTDQAMGAPVWGGPVAD